MTFEEMCRFMNALESIDGAAKEMREILRSIGARHEGKLTRSFKVTSSDYPYAAEQSVLGAIMLDNSYAAKVMGSLSLDLKPSLFDGPGHAAIYQAMETLFGKQEPIDEVTVVHELKKAGTLEEAGGSLYVSQLVEMIPTSCNIETHAKIVVEQAEMRQRERVIHANGAAKLTVGDVLDEALRREKEALKKKLLSESDASKQEELLVKIGEINKKLGVKPRSIEDVLSEALKTYGDDYK